MVLETAKTVFGKKIHSPGGLMKIIGPLETSLPRRTRHSFSGKIIQTPFSKKEIFKSF